MNRIDVYALGNALVDIEYHLSSEDLKHMSIHKGVMTLIDENEHNHRVNHLGDSHEKMACGGSAANTLIAIAQMGGSSYFSCCVGSDMAGQFYLQDLADHGVQSNASKHRDSTQDTGKCLVFVTPDADRTMNTYLGASSLVNRQMIDTEALRNSEYVYLEGYLASEEHSCEAVLKAKQLSRAHQVKTALTLSDPSMMQYFGDRIQRMLEGGVDLLFANEDEIKSLYRTDNLHSALDQLQTQVGAFAVTRGARGAVLWDGVRRIEIDSHPVKAIDTLGAGDLFAGAFLYGLTHAMDFVTSGKFASYASSKIVTQYGPRLSNQQCVDLLHNFQLNYR